MSQPLLSHKKRMAVIGKMREKKVLAFISVFETLVKS